MALQQIANTDISSTGTFALGSVSSSALTSGRVTFATAGGLLTDSSTLTYDGTTLTSTKFAGALNGTVGATTPSTVVATSVTNSGLTSGRVTYASTGGLLTDSSNLTFNGTTLTANTIGAFTLGGTVSGGGNQINNVIIGNSTPLAGSFTTLSATGNATLGSYITLTGTGTALTGGSTTGYCYVGNSDSTNLIQFNGSSHATLAGQMQFFVSGATRATVSSTGLAINGNLSVTGTTTFAGDITTTLGKFYVVNTYGYYFGGSGNLTGFTGSNGTGTITLSTYGTTRATFDTNGVTLTGTISSSGSLTVKGQTHTAPWFAAERSSSTTLQFKIVGAETTGYTASTGTVSAPWTNVIDNNNSDFMISTLLGGGTGGNIILDGKVGIGTISPNAKLQVTTSSFPVLKVADNLGGGAIALGDSTISSNYVGIWRGAANSISGGGFLNVQGNNIAFMSTDAVFGSATRTMTLDNSGNLGLGTTVNNYRFNVKGGGSVGDSSVYAQFTTLDTGTTASDGLLIGLGVGSSPIAYINQTENAALVFQTNFTERMRIASDGQVIVSTTGISGTVKITSTDGAGGYGANMALNNTGTGGRQYWISSTSNGDGEVSGGKMKFYDATANATRMLIDSSGNVGIGESSPQTKLHMTDGTLRIDGVVANAIYIRGAATVKPYITINEYGVRSWNVGAGVYSSGTFSIQSNDVNGVYLGGTATSWASASDERIKDIIEPIADALTKVNGLRSVIGKYKTDEEGVRRSFLIAQDIQAHFPEALESSDPDKLGVQYTDVIPLLVAAIKEQQALIESMAAKLKDAGVAGF